MVNDYTGSFLTPDQVATLESKLVAYNDSTSNQVAVVIMRTIGNYSPADFVNELGRKWGVGGKEYNNGVVILITTEGGQGRRHVFIGTGYGLEKSIPDITAKQIVDDEMIPQLRAGNPYRAINDAVDAIMRAAAGEYKAPERARDGNGKGSPIFFMLIVLFIIIMAISRRGGGGGRGGMMSRRGYGRSVPPIIWFPGGFGGGGGGWSGGGGGGGGGFGGFGGGSFGGGGAGGSW
ncbi:MAG TPA: TPM domain-containing protein [Chitinophagaceae bacterium]